MTTLETLWFRDRDGLWCVRVKGGRLPKSGIVLYSYVTDFVHAVRITAGDIEYMVEKAEEAARCAG